jgi:hypothetical protein
MFFFVNFFFRGLRWFSKEGMEGEEDRKKGVSVLALLFHFHVNNPYTIVEPMQDHIYIHT